MATQMDPIRATRHLEKWINFYGMDDRNSWPPEDYTYVKKACKAIQLAIDVLRENDAYETSIRKAAAVLDEWPTIHSMDDPDVWDPMDFPFVQNALEAIIFASTFLKKQQAGRSS